MDNQNTDVVGGNSLQTEGFEPVSITDENSRPVSKDLDFSEILNSSGKSKEDRGGLSRKEFKALKNQKEDNNFEDDDEIDPVEEVKYLRKQNEEILSKLNQVASKNTAKESENIILTALEEKGVSHVEFNKFCKDDFITEKNRLVSYGMPLDEAVRTALELTVKPLEIKNKAIEAEEKAKGRERASLSASGGNTGISSSIKKPTRNEYMGYADKHGIEAFNGMNEYFESRGEKPYQD